MYILLFRIVLVCTYGFQCSLCQARLPRLSLPIRDDQRDSTTTMGYSDSCWPVTHVWFFSPQKWYPYSLEPWNTWGFGSSIPPTEHRILSLTQWSETLSLQPGPFIRGPNPDSCFFLVAHARVISREIVVLVLCRSYVPIPVFWTYRAKL